MVQGKKKQLLWNEAPVLETGARAGQIPPTGIDLLENGGIQISQSKLCGFVQFS